MSGQWRIRISGKQREPVDRDLLVQAVIALGRQLRDEEHSSARSAREEGCTTTDPEITGNREDES
jgi:hypothetical protein